MDRGPAFLAALQLADSWFPVGAFSHSFGLETLVAEGVVDSAAVLGEVLDVHLRERLGRAELPALLAAQAAASEEEVFTIDRALTAVKLAQEERRASERAGARLAVEAARLMPDPALEALIVAVGEGRTPGNAAVALALAGRAMGLRPSETALVACHTAAVALLSAAQRLMRLGHGQAQALLAGAHPTMVAVVAEASRRSWRELAPCAPQLDVASARHQRSSTRLFAS